MGPGGDAGIEGGPAIIKQMMATRKTVAMPEVECYIDPTEVAGWMIGESLVRRCASHHGCA